MQFLCSLKKIIPKMWSIFYYFFNSFFCQILRKTLKLSHTHFSLPLSFPFETMPRKDQAFATFPRNIKY